MKVPDKPADPNEVELTEGNKKTPPKDALYRWGTPEDAAEVQYDYSDDGVLAYRFEAAYPPYEWLQVVRGCYPWLSVCLRV